MSCGGRTTKIHLAAASDRIAVIFSLSGGEKHDAPEGRKLIKQLQPTEEPCSLLMDRAYEDNETRELSKIKGFNPVVPPKKSRLEPWDYDKELYKRRNEVERLFRRIKRFRRVFTRYEKLDVMYLAFLIFALIVDAIK
jgi:transposase